MGWNAHALEDYDISRKSEWSGSDDYSRDNDNNLNPGSFNRSLDGLSIILAAYILKRIKTEDYPSDSSNNSGFNNSGIVITQPSNSEFNNLSKDFLSKIQNQQSKLQSIHARIVPRETKSV